MRRVENHVKGRLGGTKRVKGSTRGAGLGKVSFPVRSASRMRVCVPATAALAAGICGLGCGAAFEVGGMKSNGSGSTMVTVLDGGRGVPEEPGHPTVGCKGNVVDNSVPIGGVPGKQQVPACCGGGITVESVLVTRVPDESVLAKWAPAGDLRLLRTRRRGTGQAVSAAGGDD